ncbi:hypothetical protein ACNKHV_10230 [Shigella flexneri]
MLFPFARFGSGNSGFDGGFARIDLLFWLGISLLLFQLACFGTGNSGFDGGFARIDLLFWLGISLLLFQLACFGTGNNGFDGGFARIDLFFWFRISLLLFQLRALARAIAASTAVLRGSATVAASLVCCSSACFALASLYGLPVLQ